MCKIILFRIFHARNQITKLFIAPWKTCHYIKLERVEIQKTKTLTVFFLKSKCLEKEKILINLIWCQSLFFQNWEHSWQNFSKKDESVFLLFTLIIFGNVWDKYDVRFYLSFFSGKYTQSITLANSNVLTIMP